MPVLAAFALAFFAGYRLGGLSCIGIALGLSAWMLLGGMSAPGIACVIAAANLGWISGLWARVSQAQHA